jgi:hypothetical protein
MNIEQIRDALTEYEIEHINSLSSRNFFHYVRNIINSKYSDDEARELYCNTIGGDDEDDES